MAILDSNDIFFSTYEPKVQNRFVMAIQGIPAYIINKVTAVGFEQGEILLNHINVYRKLRGKTKWNDVTVSLYDPITPSGAQAVMEWMRLHHESVTGRDGYSDFYKKNVSIQVLGPVGDIISEWVLMGAFIKSANFGDYDYAAEGTPQMITMVLGMDYCVLNF